MVAERPTPRAQSSSWTAARPPALRLFCRPSVDDNAGHADPAAWGGGRARPRKQWNGTGCMQDLRPADAGLPALALVRLR